MNSPRIGGRRKEEGGRGWQRARTAYSRREDISSAAFAFRLPPSAFRIQTPTARPASHSTILPATADAATVHGDATYSCPGPDRPGKLRLIAEMVTSSFVRDTPGPASMQAPHEGSTKIAPTAWNTSSYPRATQY